MANKKETNTSQNGVDPDLEKKVDELMSVELPDHSESLDEQAPVESTAPDGAPLLPSEKLPDFGKKEEPAKPVLSQLAPIEPIPKAPQEPIQDSSELEDPATNKAVDDILAEESNQLLAAEDAKRNRANQTPKPKGLGAKIKTFFSSWWHNPLYRRLTIMVVILSIIAVFAIPASRYFMLNNLGVRSSSSVVVLDEKTSQPLKNVEVQLSGQSAKTDKEGKAKLSNVKLGPQTLVIKKPAFAENQKTITIGWGSNPLGEVKLKPVGSQYTFELTDFLSGKPIKDAEATSGESSAQTNDNGEIVLTIPNGKETEIEVAITSDNYRTENLRLAISNKEVRNLQLVPARKAVFVSKRTGTYDVYKVDVDGKNEEKIFAGTGSEREDAMALVPHPTKEVAAFVSTRGQAKNQDGFQLSTLTLIDVGTKETTKIADSERIQIVGWIGNKLVYVKIAQGASAADNNRHRLMSYDIDSEADKELASTNYFNDVMIAKGSIYYSPAVYKVNGNVGLFKISADGSNKQTVYDKEVWNLFRTDYDSISASVGQDWYRYQISSNAFTKADGPPALLKSRIYVDSPDNTRSLWVDDRDGKGVLLAYEISSNKDNTAQTAAGLKNPVRWLDNDHVVYRISNSQETADYVLSLSGGAPKKISDVTNIAGLDRWYYY